MKITILLNDPKLEREIRNRSARFGLTHGELCRAAIRRHVTQLTEDEAICEDSEVGEKIRRRLAAERARELLSR